MGCNCSSENEPDEEEIIPSDNNTAHVQSTQPRRPNAYLESEVQHRKQHNYPDIDNFLQQMFVSEQLDIENFVPLKLRYFGPVLNIDSRNGSNSLTNNMVFGGWNTTYKELIVKLPLNCEESIAVVNLFSKTSRNISSTLSVVGIFRVENKFLYASYLLKKDEMISRNGYVDELNLYHGTKIENLKSICNDNFNWKKFGDNTGNRFGKGVSFTPKATYAAHYCDRGRIKVMFLAKVLVSKAIVGDENMLIPIEETNGKRRFYDTSVKPNIDVVVKYGSNEFYPAYIILFNIKNSTT